MNFRTSHSHRGAAVVAGTLPAISPARRARSLSEAERAGLNLPPDQRPTWSRPLPARLGLLDYVSAAGLLLGYVLLLLCCAVVLAPYAAWQRWRSTSGSSSGHPGGSSPKSKPVTGPKCDLCGGAGVDWSRTRGATTFPVYCRKCRD